MEVTSSGKHGKPSYRLLTLPTVLGNPFGIPTPTLRRRGDLLISDRVCLAFDQNQRHFLRKGLVNSVPGTKRKSSPGADIRADDIHERIDDFA